MRREIPFTSWSGFLRLEAGKGNEIALAILRSRKEAVEPELQTPVKDWSQHGMERFSLRAAHAEKERTVLEREDVSTRGKRQLQAFARMERIAEEARAQGRAIGEVKRRIDGRGEILFTLDNGASIRDTGKEVFSSAHDDKAREIALRYAGLKWGRNIAMEKSRILFHQSPDLQQDQARDRGWSR